MSKIYGIIDIGSNSVRLMMAVDGKSAGKMSITTRLAEGMENGVLTDTSVKRTAKTVAMLNETAISRGAEGVYAFATAAVRNAANGDVFLRLVKEYCGLDIDVLSGEEEALIGYSGALGGFDGGLIDVGGASSEVIVVKNGKPVYIHSLNVGAVKVKDACGQDGEKADLYIKEKIKEYGEVPSAEFYAVGGTATSVAAMLLSLKIYDRNKTDGFKVKTTDLKNLADKLFSMTVEDRKKLRGLQPKRAEIIAGGALLLYRITEKLGIDCFTVSESDNLEGYLKEKVIKIEKKN